MKPNWFIFGFAVWFWYLETAYFGWNEKPGSTAELFADGLSLLMLALAWFKPVHHTTINTHEVKYYTGEDNR